eukprot:TRINITY_DN3690_c0_g1_i2.p1 TRINITY_DN3690_c0_g1~~TRINITY_DN3690_c0_g1_i2.p1  ORF type:complete len:729 (+),score=195.87 TRINITY_DN3690_c0_g1_i2:187-2187(+)
MGGDNTITGIRVFTSSGVPLCDLPTLPGENKIIKMGWTNKEQLVVIYKDGNVYLFNIRGELDYKFSLGTTFSVNGVYDVKLWDDGMLVMSDNTYDIFAINDFEDPQPRSLAKKRLESPPTSWEVIDPKFTSTGNPEALVATNTGTILIYDFEKVVDMNLTNVPFTKLSVSPTGKMLACFTQLGMLLVVPTDFASILSEFNTQSKIPPTQLEWCGGDSVVLYWELKKLVLMVGPNGQWLKYQFEEPIYLVPELDGIRIFSSKQCEMLQKVPDTTEDIFKIASTAPSALLFEAYKNFEKKNPKADEMLRSIKKEGYLPKAIDECIEAASYEFDVNRQRKLLSAAGYGKSFLDDYNPDTFVDVCKKVRVLNDIRRYKIGVPLTFKQFEEMTPNVLVDRLSNRHHHFLAFRICEQLNLKTNKVLVHWACAKVKTKNLDIRDQDIKDSIVNKLSSLPGISYVDIASTAHKYGRPNLARDLLDYEPKAGDQVPLLLKMKEESHALAKAVECGDTDLVYMVILFMHKNRSLQQFFEGLGNKRIAYDLLIVYCKEKDHELLRYVYSQLDMPYESGHLSIMAAFDNNEEKMMNNLSLASNIYSKNKKYAFFSKQTDDQIRLFRIQTDLDTQFEGIHKFKYLSLGDTIFKLVEITLYQQAAKLAKEFKVPWFPSFS